METGKQIEKMRAEVAKRVSEKRYRHCERTAALCRTIAEKYGFDPEKAELAGLVHDIAKEMSKQELIDFCRSRDIFVSYYELENYYLLHGVVGAHILQEEYGIDDAEVLNAVAYHIGHPAMTKLEKIVFLADHLDKAERCGFDKQPFLEEPDLNLAITGLLRLVLSYYIEHGIQVEEITFNTFDYLLKETAHSGPQVQLEDTASAISDEAFDLALEICRSHALKLKSLHNCRDLGGYRNSEGRIVRKNMLLRSARLSDLTAADAEQLRSIGITHIIDLRTPEEIEEHPDVSADAFEYCRCPLPSIELSAHQKLIREWYLHSSGEKQKTWYLSEFIRDIDMKQMYLDVLTQREAVRSLRRVLDILLSDRCNGALFHCTSGKDRTGVTAILILSLLSCREEDIRNDYQASVPELYLVTETLSSSLSEEGYRESEINEIRYYSGIGGDMFDHIMRIIRNEYGSIKQYAHECLGLDPGMIDRLKEKYLYE